MPNEQKKLVVEDASKLDEKIPRGLIIMYQNQPYITKAGLEWKANKLYGAGGYSLATDIVEANWEKNIFVIKATMTYLQTGATWVNYGFATPENVNSMMQKQLFHLAITRAECRVLRMATACGYAAYDEVVTQDKRLALIASENDMLPITDAQKQTLETLGGSIEPDMTQAMAREAIATLSQKGRKS